MSACCSPATAAGVPDRICATGDRRVQIHDIDAQERIAGIPGTHQLIRNGLAGAIAMAKPIP